MFDLPIVQSRVLALIEKAPFVFYLTGSRKLTPSYVLKDTDWDFFVEDTEQVAIWLEKYSFEDLNDPNYMDNGLVHVYRRENIDIQVRRDVIDWQRKQARLLELPEVCRFAMLMKTHPRDLLSQVWDSL